VVAVLLPKLRLVTALTYACVALQMESRVSWFEAFSPLTCKEMDDVLVDATPPWAEDEGVAVGGAVGVTAVVGLDVAGTAVGFFVGSDVVGEEVEVATEGDSVGSDVVGAEVLGDEVVGASVVGRSVGDEVGVASVVGLSVGKLVGDLVGALVGETVGAKVVRTSVLEADDVTAGARVGDEPSLAVSAPPSVISLLKALKDIRRLSCSFASFRRLGLNGEASA